MSHINYRKNPFEISELAEFDNNIKSYTKSEQLDKRKAYLIQAINKIGYEKKLLNSLGCMMIPFLIIPLFWPVLIFMHYTKRKAIKLINEQIESACLYWNIDKKELTLQ
jgi:hypothetical protein